jgi:hypothetical protein
MAMLIFKQNGWTPGMAFAITLATATVLGGTARANLLMNGNFALDFDPSQPSNIYCTGCSAGSISDWTTSGNAGSESQVGSGSSSDMNAFIGTGTLSQTYSTISGTTYAVTFSLAADGTLWADPFDATIGATDPFSIDINSFPVTYTPPDYLPGSFTFTATSSSSTLTFTGNVDTGTWLIDDVSVDPIVVPEPNSLAILASALLGFGAYEITRRRHRMLG